jgi:hypothetical protein
VHAKNSRALQNTGALPPRATLHFKRLFYPWSRFCQGFNDADAGIMGSKRQ